MEDIIFVTHNKGKIASANKRLAGVNFKVFEHDLEEPRSDDIKYISKYKVLEAYKLVNKPCISLDCGFWIDELDGFPKAFVNFALDTIGIDGIKKGKHEGKLSNQILGNYTDKKWSDLWYIFIPSGYEKTLAQMTDDERTSRIKYESIDAMSEFAKWYKEK